MIFQLTTPKAEHMPIVAAELSDVVWLALNFYQAESIKRCIRVGGIWYAWI